MESDMPMRFCTSCQAHRPESTGVFKKVNKTRRWICRSCIERKSESIYRNVTGRDSTESDIRRAFQRVIK